ncbi:hypothetical protein MMC10_001077 [Thelotrema lepadinum]|nr:hypothetical protein [Thelotrema lepadinum]
MASVSPLRRPHQLVDFLGPQPASPRTENPSISSPSAYVLNRTQEPELPDNPARDQESIVLAPKALSPAESKSQDTMARTNIKPAQAGSPSKKRKKLTAEEKKEQEELKAHKEAEKRQKEEEKKVKQAKAEEVRKIKAEQEEEKRKIREAEKAKKDEAKKQKEAEKKAKDEEKAKKERSQQRINAFFAKPKPTSESATSSRRNSVGSCDENEGLAPSRAGSEASQPIITDYEKAFPPFFIHPHVTLAPALLYSIDREKAGAAMEEIQKGNETRTESADDAATYQQHALRSISVLGKRRKRYLMQPSTRELVSQIQGSSSDSVDLTSTTEAASLPPLEMLRSLPIKYLKYREDVRPPWKGTYSKRPTNSQNFKKLCRNPFTKALPKVDYDYDSEAEWEEPEEGEELGSEDEEDGDEEEGDMEGFVDDTEEGSPPKKRQLLGDMEPIYTPMLWENSLPSNQPHTVPYGYSILNLAPFQMETLLSMYPQPSSPLNTNNPQADLHFPINPYSPSYWSSTDTTKPPSTTPSTNPFDILNMGPPIRHPLNTIKGPNQPAPTQSQSKVGPVKASKLSNATPLPAELLEDFKKAVDGSDLTKLGLVEILKKKFPSATKNTVEQTLLQVAERVGSKVAEKRWKLRES